MQTKAWSVWLMILCTAFTSTAQVLYKFGANKLEFNFMGLIANLPLISGMALYVLGAVIMITAFKGGEVSVLYPIVATSGQIGIDSGILSVFSLARIDRENTKPLGIDKIKTGENLPLGNTNYFVFSYPGSTITAQFSIAIVKSSHPSEPYTLKLASTNTTTSPGSSGGAVCNQNGEVIAVVTGHIGNEAIEFIADPIPQNISYQIEMAIQNSRSILLTNNITQSP